MKNTGTLKVTTPTEREIVLTRVFDAPRSVVVDAWTKPELLKRWMGPRSWSLVVCEIDLKVGGAYGFVGRGPNGTDVGWRGVYREIVAPEQLVATESFDESWYSGEALVTSVLVERMSRDTVNDMVRKAVAAGGTTYAESKDYGFMYHHGFRNS